LLVLGPITRSVRDAALFTDVATAVESANTFRDGLKRSKGPLSIAVSTIPPPGPQVSLSLTGRRAVEEAVSLLTGHGHEILEIDLDYR
jgi:Asp-tRNA(Asn)/Glu-tRNA(Gln) amidotransferase A subunit family amidase